MQHITKELSFPSNDGESDNSEDRFYYYKKYEQKPLVIHETSLLDGQSIISTNENYLNLPEFMMIKNIPQAAKDKLEDLQQQHFKM